jgi:hypothetical protein
MEDLQSLECLIGQPDDDHADPLAKALPQLSRHMADEDCWEVIQKPRA